MTDVDGQRLRAAAALTPDAGGLLADEGDGGSRALAEMERGGQDGIVAGDGDIGIGSELYAGEGGGAFDGGSLHRAILRAGRMRVASG